MTGRLPGMGPHRAESTTDDWLTPPDLLRRLGRFDLDPCTPIDPMPWQTADLRFSLDDDGLALPWTGRVWLNPPYSNVAPWVRKLRRHGNGIALVFARTETAWWHDEIWHSADAILFLRGRLTFLRPDGGHARSNGGRDGGNGNAGAPSALVAYGSHNALRLRVAGIAGALTTPAVPLYASPTGALSGADT